MDEEVYLRTPRWVIPIGLQSEVRAACREITDLTGGSSGGGRWSRVFGLMDAHIENACSDSALADIAEEARDLRAAFEDSLPDQARRFLDRLAVLA